MPPPTELEVVVSHHRRLAARVAQLEDKLVILERRPRFRLPELTSGQYVAALLGLSVASQIMAALLKSRGARRGRGVR